MTHYDDDVLMLYTIDPTYVPDHEALARHLLVCTECESRMRAINEVDQALGANETWRAVGERVDGDQHLTRFRELASRYRSEDEEARGLLSSCLSDPVRFVWENIPPKTRYRTAGCVRLLCLESSKMCETNPLHARNLAEVAAAIAELLPTEPYGENVIHQLYATAQCELANAFRYLAEFKAAHVALDRAATAYDNSIAPAVERKRVDYIRATVFWKEGEYAKGLPLIRKTSEEFLRHGDLARYNDAKTIEGGMLFDQHRIAEALAIFQRVKSSVDAQMQPVMAARAASNVANCYVEMRDTDAASRHFLTALQLYEHAGVTTEIARTRWSIGCLALAAGDPREAVRRLRATKSQFESLHMFYEAGLVTLDLMDASLAAGEVRQIREMAALVVQHVQSSGSGSITGALTAAAFVREAATLGTLTRTTIQTVRRYLRDVRDNPALIFCPPPNDPPM